MGEAKIYYTSFEISYKKTRTPHDEKWVNDLANEFRTNPYFNNINEDSLCSLLLKNINEVIVSFNWGKNDIDGFSWILGLFCKAVGLGFDRYKLTYPKLFIKIFNEKFNINDDSDLKTDFESTMLTEEDMRYLSHLPQSSLMFQMIPLKDSIQKEIISLLTDEEKLSIKLSQMNKQVVNKLINLSMQYYKLFPNKTNLYCLCMVIATIIKEYEWGDYFLTTQGILYLSEKIFTQ